MVQLQIISGKQMGLLWEARSFPARVGRGADMDLQLDEAGVWEQHFELSLDAETGFNLTAHPGAILSVNQAPTASARLRNGDIITAGGAQISFRLSPTRQRSLRWREWSVWALLATVTVGQAALIGWLLR